MSRLLLIAALVAFVAGSAHAQSFPTKPLILICPAPSASIPDHYLRAISEIASKFLGQPVMVENRPGGNNTVGPATMVESARSDGHTLAQLTINSLRVPHMRKVSWDPIRDFTYIIGLAGYTFGIAVKTDSQIKTLNDLIDYAKANPGKLYHGMSARGSTGHLIMEELGLKTGVRFLHVPGSDLEAAKALIDGRILAISGNVYWGPHVDSGAFRLLVTFGEGRSRWNAPTAKELGTDILAYSPFGIVGPKGMDPKVTKILHDAFYRTLDDPEYDGILKRLDLVDWYKSSDDYSDWAVDQFKFQQGLIERSIGLGRN